MKNKIVSNPPSIGIAFGAGGARGIAHLLMIEALDELGVKPSIISGSSIGAVVGAFYAAGFSAKEMKEILNQLINPKSDSVFDFLLKSDILSPVVASKAGKLNCISCGGTLSITTNLPNELKIGHHLSFPCALNE